MKTQIGKKVIVRADRAGVFYGTLSAQEGNEVQMTNVKKLHYWEGAAAVEQLALDGTNRPSGCRFTVYVEELTIMQVIQIIPCSKKAIQNIESVESWKK